MPSRVRADARVRLERDDGVADRSTEHAVDRQTEATLSVQLDLESLHGSAAVAGADGRHQSAPSGRADDAVGTEALGGLERLGRRHGRGAEHAVGGVGLAVLLQQVLDRQYVGASVVAALGREESVGVGLCGGGQQADQ